MSYEQCSVLVKLWWVYQLVKPTMRRMGLSVQAFISSILSTESSHVPSTENGGDYSPSVGLTLKAHGLKINFKINITSHN